MNASEALEKLKNGNARYLHSISNTSHITESDRRNTVEKGQHPYACIIDCSDSRVVPEHIFSTGIGELFTIRTAGNTIGVNEMGSAEYAALHLHTPLIVVMGHTHCGAVQAAIEGHAEGSIQNIVSKIQCAIKENKNPRECEILNADQSAKDLLQSPYLKTLVDNGELKIVRAIYDTETGKVVF